MTGLVTVVLFCYILNVMLCYVWKIKNVDKNKKEMRGLNISDDVQRRELILSGYKKR